MGHNNDKSRVRLVNSEALDKFLKGTKLTGDYFIAHSFGGFHETIKHDTERSPGILCSIPVSIEIDTKTITGELVTAGAVYSVMRGTMPKVPLQNRAVLSGGRAIVC